MSTSPLRVAIEVTAVEHGVPMKDLTVLATQHDPFRVDTPARHRDGEWLAVTARELGLGHRRIHLRGLHYMVIGRPKPNGTPYTNTDDDWLWLSEDCGKAARWLGYIPFDQIVDQRNAAPTIEVFTEPTEVTPWVSAGLHVEIPDAADLEPSVYAGHYVDQKYRSGFPRVQPYKLVMFGEKSSLADVLGPIAREHHADLYLPTGEISDTLLYQMASVGAADGRPMVVLTFSDADPSGWQMPISIARKLQAFQVALFPDLEFQVHRVALTPDQVREYGLPSTPLKDTEKRADKWRSAMGVEQTEIDAIAALQPHVLRRLVRDALAPFYDSTLDARVADAYGEWREAAQEVIDNSVDADWLDGIRAQAEERLTELQEQVEALNNEVRIDVGDLDLPDLVLPEAEVSGEYGVPLLDSRWSFVDQCRSLIASKAYRSYEVGDDDDG